MIELKDHQQYKMEGKLQFQCLALMAQALVLSNLLNKRSSNVQVASYGCPH